MLNIMVQGYKIPVVVLDLLIDNQEFHTAIKEYVNKKTPVVLYMRDTIDRHLDKFEFMDDYHQNYYICTAGPYWHPKNIVNLDTLVDSQQYNKDISITKKPSRIYDFLLMPGKAQVWRLELVKALLEQNLLDNSLWSLCNPGGAIVPITERKMPEHYELENLDMNKMIYQGENHLNRVLVPSQYEDSRCSIVCETSISDDRVYLTEKTWKPLLAGHPFVAQANPGFFNYLKELGFKTFSNIWSEEDYSLNGLVEVCKDIKNMDESEFLDLTFDICEHNSIHAKEKNWIREFHLEQLRSKNLI